MNFNELFIRTEQVEGRIHDFVLKNKRASYDIQIVVTLSRQLSFRFHRIFKHFGKECFHFSENFLRITFPKSSGGQIGGQVESAMGGAIEDLTDRQREVLELIIADPRISRSQLAERLGINESAIQKHIEVLKKKGIIEREGETTGSWKLNL